MCIRDSNNLVQLFLNQTFLRSQLALKEQEQKLAEMTALQLQINPHFLFNTCLLYTSRCV